jgi:hypothetical protein
MPAKMSLPFHKSTYTIYVLVDELNNPIRADEMSSVCRVLSSRITLFEVEPDFPSFLCSFFSKTVTDACAYPEVITSSFLPQSPLKLQNNKSGQSRPGVQHWGVPFNAGPKLDPTSVYYNPPVVVLLVWGVQQKLIVLIIIL